MTAIETMKFLLHVIDLQDELIRARLLIEGIRKDALRMEQEQKLKEQAEKKENGQ